MARLARAGIIFVSALSLWVALPLVRADEFAVTDVKAMLIGKIAEFVRWPESADLKREDASFSVVFLGNQALYTRARALLAGRVVLGRQVSVRSVTEVSEAGFPHILFVGAEQRQALPRIVALMAGHPVLTMSDTSGFAEAGVGINLVLLDSRVRFEVNREALRKANVQPSFRLFAVSRVIGAAP